MVRAGVDYSDSGRPTSQMQEQVPFGGGGIVHEKTEAAGGSSKNQYHPKGDKAGYGTMTPSPFLQQHQEIQQRIRQKNQHQPRPAYHSMIDSSDDEEDVDEEEDQSLLDEIDEEEDEWNHEDGNEEDHNRRARDTCNGGNGGLSWGSTTKFLKNGGTSIKNIFTLVANVENLWDSPDPYVYYPRNNNNNNGDNNQEETDTPSTYQSGHQYDNHPPQRQPRRGKPRDRSYFVVLFWFIILALSYTTERSSFKLLVDQSGPFRLFSAIMVTLSHSTMLVLGMIAYALCTQRGKFAIEPLGVPILDVGVMALLDTMQLLLVFLTAIFVTPTTTVILVQLTFPLTAIMAQFVNPEGRCSFYRSTDEDEYYVNEHGLMTMECRNGEGEEEQQQCDDYNNGIQSSSSLDGDVLQSSHRKTHDDYDNSNENRSIISSCHANDNGAGIVIAVPEGTPLPNCGGLSAEHVWGSIIIGFAVILSLLPYIYSISNPSYFKYADPIPMRTAINTLLYAGSCIPAAASQIYKEHIFLRYKQPVNINYLNLLLSVSQLIIASMLAPLVYGLQGLATSFSHTDDAASSSSWTSIYPSKDIKQNFADGLYCYLGLLDEQEAKTKYFDSAYCSNHESDVYNNKNFNFFTAQSPFRLCLCNALSIIVIGIAVDKICNAGATKAMYRGISVGITLSVFVMYLYDLQIPQYSYGPVFDAMHFAVLFILILGTEIYHRVTLQGATYETVYPEVGNLYTEHD